MLGELLVSANGKGHKAIAKWWIAILVVAAIGAVVCYFCANKFGIDAGVSGLRLGGITFWEGTQATKNNLYWIFMGLAVFFIVGSLIEGYLMHTRISKTAIYVHEKGIKGLSVVPKFPLSLFLYFSIASLQLADFQLTYDLVSSVEVVDGNTLIINTRDAKHKVYAKNAGEIRDTMSAQKSKIG